MVTSSKKHHERYISILPPLPNIFTDFKIAFIESYLNNISSWKMCSLTAQENQRLSDLKEATNMYKNQRTYNINLLKPSEKA
jgi:hypothetical protein